MDLNFNKEVFLMARTINKKSFDNIIKALAAPFDVNDFKPNKFGFYYLPVEKYQQRMDEVVGILNYDFITSEPRTCIVGTKPHISLSGTITIRDDDGNVVTQKSACGGCPVIMKNADNEAAAYKNDLESATQDVFKRCCKRLGIAEAQLKQLRREGKGSSEDIGGNAQTVSLYRVKLRESFSSLGKNGYSAMVDVEGEDEPRKLVIWQSAIVEIEKYIPIAKFINCYKANMEFSLYGTLNVWKPKNGSSELQLVMEKPYVNEEGS